MNFDVYARCIQTFPLALTTSLCDKRVFSYYPRAIQVTLMKYNCCILNTFKDYAEVVAPEIPRATLLINNFEAMKLILKLV